MKIKTARTLSPAAIFLATFLTACAGGPRNESLETATADNGRKIFTYKVEMPMPDGIGRHSGPPPGADNASRRIPVRTVELEAMRDQIKVDIYTRFQDRIEQSGYCPNGYSAGQVQLGPVSVIEGECVELPQN